MFNEKKLTVLITCKRCVDIDPIMVYDFQTIRKKLTNRNVPKSGPMYALYVNTDKSHRTKERKKTCYAFT